MNDQYVLECIRNGFLNTKSNDAYNLNAPNLKNPSMGQAQLLIQILKNKKKGFFVECGALDGETRSNTLYMERFLGWEGVLIEADPSNYRELETKNRKAWSVPACLSIKPYPSKVTFEMRRNQGRIAKNQDNRSVKRGEVQVQCFPLYSILLALNQTVVDYFSLDVEGAELGVLRTIPFDKIDIKVSSLK
ncbi:protein Star-like isoform X2 [Artemia franciscana]